MRFRDRIKGAIFFSWFVCGLFYEGKPLSTIYRWSEETALCVTFLCMILMIVSFGWFIDPPKVVSSS